MATTAEFLSDLLEIYNETGFHAEVEKDLNDGSVWFNPAEFGRYHDIEGVKVLAVFTADRRSKVIDIRNRSDENPEGVVKSGGVLFVRASELMGARAGQQIRLDSRLYRVVEATLIQAAVWRITLEANEI